MPDDRHRREMLRLQAHNYGQTYQPYRADSGQPHPEQCIETEVWRLLLRVRDTGIPITVHVDGAEYTFDGCWRDRFSIVLPRAEIEKVLHVLRRDLAIYDRMHANAVRQWKAGS